MYKNLYFVLWLIVQGLLSHAQISIDTRKVIEGEKTFTDVKIGRCECKSITFRWKIYPLDINDWNNVAAQVAYTWQPKAGTDSDCLAKSRFKYVSLPIQYVLWGQARMYINTTARESQNWPPDFNWTPQSYNDEFTWFNLFCKKKYGPTAPPDYDGVSTISEIMAKENSCGCWHEARAKKLWNTRFTVDGDNFVYWIDQSTDNKGRVQSYQQFPDFKITEADLGLKSDVNQNLILASQPDNGELVTCKNGLQVILDSEYLGSCENPSDNSMTGHYFRYKIELYNTTASEIKTSPTSLFFYGKTPFNIKCLPNEAGGSFSASGTYTIGARSSVKVAQFDLMFHSYEANDEFIRQSIPKLKNICGADGVVSGTGSISGSTPSSKSRTNSSVNSKDQDRINTEKKASQLVKAGKYEEAKKVWDQYEARHPEDSDLAASKRLAIHSNMNDNAQAARNDQEKKEMGALTASMMAFGAFMYKNLGDDKDKNIYAGKPRRMNFTCGYSMSFMPVYMNSVSSIYNGSSTVAFYDAEKKMVGTVNLDLGFQYWPYYSKNLGIGLLTDVYGGYIPIGGSTFSYLYQYGVQGYAGTTSLKGLFSFTMGDKGFSTVQKFSSGSYDDSSTGEGGARFSRIMGGARYSIKTDSHPVHHFDLSYVIERYPNMKQIKGSGMNFTYSAHNRLKIYGEYMFKGARVGVIEPDFTLEAPNTGSYIRFGVIRSMDWFQQ